MKITYGAIESKNDEVMAVDISKDGKYLATGGDDGYVEIWDLNSYQLIHRMKSNSDDTFALAFSSDSSKIASAGEEEVIDVWSVQGGEQLAKLEGHQEDIRTFARSHPSSVGIHMRATVTKPISKTK